MAADIRETTTTNLLNEVSDINIGAQVLDSAESDEYFYDNPNFSEYLGYYKEIPELKKAIDALAIWTVGKGYETDALTQAILESLTGHGKDNDDTLLFNLFVIKKVNGDAYAQIIRRESDNELINLKILNPSRVRVVFGKDGMIKRYEYQQNDKKFKTIPKEEMLHLINDKVGDEVHGTSIIEACKWVIDARAESMEDWRRILHRSTIRIIEVDDDNPDTLSTLKTEYKEAIKNGEVLLVPKGNTAFPNAPLNYIDPQNWIQYLENFFYQAVGVPRVIATSENFTEASSKIGYLSFEPIYTREQQILEAELWNQLQIKMTFSRPASLAGALEREEEQNSVQTGFQPNDVQAGVGA